MKFHTAFLFCQVLKAIETWPINADQLERFADLATERLAGEAKRRAMENIRQWYRSYHSNCMKQAELQMLWRNMEQALGMTLEQAVNEIEAGRVTFAELEQRSGYARERELADRQADGLAGVERHGKGAGGRRRR